MVEFEKVEGEELKFGENKFIEVTRKRAVSGEGEKEFLALVRGYYDEQGKKRYKNNLSLPMEEEVVEFVVKELPRLLKE